MTIGQHRAPARTHVLLTVLGRSPRPACYTLANRKTEQQLAPVALFNLLPAPERPDCVRALCTPEAKCESWPLLEEALKGKCLVESVDISTSGTQEGVNDYLKSVVDAVPQQDVEITVDVTHGYRHFSFLTYIAILYMAALREIHIRGAYYGMLNHDRPSPFLDLRPILELPDWVYAVRVLRDTGSAVPIAEALREGTQNQSAKNIMRHLTHLSEAYLSGLPIELGWLAHTVREQHLKPLGKRLRDHHHLPLGGELVDRIDQILKPIALVDAPTPGDGWKKKMALTPCELQRQVKVIDGLLQRESIATALGLMSEWTVSWVVWRQSEEDHQNPGDNWLDYGTTRRGAANLLGAIAAIQEDSTIKDVLSEDQRSLGCYWRKLSDLRNGYAHHGMRLQVLIGDRQIQNQKNLEYIRQYWKETLCLCPSFPLSLSQSPGRVLVSPIGMRPGVLFSALHAYRAENVGEPALCLVICSRETEGKIAEAVRNAGYVGAIEPLRLEDPYGGRSEIDRLAHAARTHLVGATEVVVNVTGGTTLMGLAAESVAGTARRLACPVRRFGLIDRRPPGEQDADPYRAGEPFWLDAVESDGAHEN